MARLTYVLFFFAFVSVFHTSFSYRLTWNQIKKVAGILEKIFGHEIDTELKFKKTYIGHSVHLLGAKIYHVDIPKFTFRNRRGYYEVSVTGFGLKAKGFWRYKKRWLWLIPVQESGSLKATVSGVNVKFRISKRSYQVTKCTDHVGNVSGVKLRGKLLAMFARIIFNIKKGIKKSLHGQVCKAVRKGINRHSNKIKNILAG